MKRRFGLTAAGLVVFLLALAAGFPAKRLQERIEQAIPGLQLAGISGSLFSGAASGVGFDGRALGPASWSFRPASLAGGRIEYAISLGLPDNRAVARAGVTFSGTPYGRQIDIVLQPDPWINRLAPIAVSSSGDARLQLDYLEWADDFPRQLQGQLQWRDAAVLAPVSLVAGNVSALLRSEGDQLVAEITEPGALGLSGDISLNADGTYAMDLELVPGVEVSGETLEMLEVVMVTRAPGVYVFQYQGRL